MRTRQVHLVVGPAGHGVVEHALRSASLVGQQICRVDTGDTPPTAAHLRDAVGDAGAAELHLHVTDHLFGTTPVEAARLLEELAISHPLSVTLHDLPQPADGPERFARRAAAYRRIAAVAGRLQVSSRYEHGLLQAFAPEAVPEVVPLPVPYRARPADPGAPVGPPTVGVLGYLYPGKGHLEVLAALETIGRPDVGLVALGRPSPGHEWLVDEIRRRSGSRPVEITGYLDDDLLDRRVAEVTVPVVAPSHISASASLLRWIGCGRRPVAVPHPYVLEVAEQHPGTVTVAPDLPAAIEVALARPQSTWQER